MKSWEIFVQNIGDIDPKTSMQNTRKYFYIPSQAILKMCDCFVLWIVGIGIIEESKIASEEEVFLILSPGFFFGREKFI
jgi:hypothetical protein